MGIQLFWDLLTSHHTWYVCKALKLGYRNGVNITYPSLNTQQSRVNNIVLCNTIFHWQNIQFIYIVLKYLCLSNAYARYMWQEETGLSQNRACRVRHNLVGGLNYTYIHLTYCHHSTDRKLRVGNVYCVMDAAISATRSTPYNSYRERTLSHHPLQIICFLPAQFLFRHYLRTHYSAQHIRHV